MKQVLFHCPRNIITSPPGWQPLLYNRCFYITMNALNELMICCLTKSAQHAWKKGAIERYPLITLNVSESEKV